MRFNYQPPVSKVLTYGKINRKRQPTPEQWPNYVEALGLTEADVPELIRLATDRECQKVPNDWVEVYGQVHGWRALGQLKAMAATEPLLGLLGDEGDDWVTDELPYVFAMIGPGSIPALAKYLGSSSKPAWGRMTTISCLRAIAETSSDGQAQSRPDCIAVLVAQLGEARHNPAELNGLMVAELVELKAVEAEDAIIQAYATGNVDELISGPLAGVLVDLGVRSREAFKPEDFEVKMPPELLEIQRLGRMGAELSHDLADAPLSLSESLMEPGSPARKGAVGGNGFGGNGFGGNGVGETKAQKRKKKR